MPATTGRYATRNAGTLAGRTTTTGAGCSAARRLGRARLDERDNGGGYTLHREWGRWTLRPITGWRSLRWTTPAPHATRAIPGHDRDAAGDWGLKVLGLA
ncbi:hypothetical protein [Pseudonocardia nigra]|uniref:hypothetical protein n=1 Tax=Pseudonocardia nigra TaxID=1921578 RepID=UPI001C60592B|nr:hypothetical protein [Pseudonocardia nigra]